MLVGYLYTAGPGKHAEFLALDMGYLLSTTCCSSAVQQKNTCFCFIDYAKAFDCVDHSKPENS